MSGQIQGLRKARSGVQTKFLERLVGQGNSRQKSEKVCGQKTRNLVFLVSSLGRECQGSCEALENLKIDDWQICTEVFAFLSFLPLMPIKVDFLRIQEPIESYRACPLMK